MAQGDPAPVLVIGMPVGFVGVADSKRRLAASGLLQLRWRAAEAALVWLLLLSMHYCGELA